MRGRRYSQEEDERVEQPCVSEIEITVLFFCYMYFLYGQCVPKQYYNKLN